jgi:hypothetical protein
MEIQSLGIHSLLSEKAQTVNMAKVSMGQKDGRKGRVVPNGQLTG